MSSGSAEEGCALVDLADAEVARGRYDEAEPLYRRGLAMIEAADGADHPDVANVLNKLAALLGILRRDNESETLARQSLGIVEDILRRAGDASAEKLELDDETAAAIREIRRQSLANLATALRAGGRYGAAEPFLTRALESAEADFGPQALDVARCLNNLGVLYKYWGKYDQAERVYLRAHGIIERATGGDSADALELDLACILYNLGGLDHARGRFEDAEPPLRRALEIKSRVVGNEHPDTAVTMSTLAAILDGQKKYDEAERLYNRALEIYEKTFGPEHPDVALNLNNLAAIEQERGNPERAETLYRRSLEIREKLLGPDHPQVGTSLNNLGLLHDSLGRNAEAGHCFERALAILEKSCGPEHPNTIACRENFAALRRPREGDVGDGDGSARARTP